MLRRLTEAGIKFNTYAEQLFAHPAFSSHQPARLQFAKLSVSDIGLVRPSTFAQIATAATSAGLRLSSLGHAADLRLAYLDQPADPYLHVACAKPESSTDLPNGFYLRHHDGALWLRGYRASDDWEYPLEMEFAFLI
jgi:hypothetical protein